MLTDWEFSVFSQVSRLCQGQKPGQNFPADSVRSPIVPLLLLLFHSFLQTRSPRSSYHAQSDCVSSSHSGKRPDFALLFNSSFCIT